MSEMVAEQALTIAPTLTIATCFWRPRDNVHRFSTSYTPDYVDRLYRGFARNLTRPFRFVCFVDREYAFSEQIEQQIDATLGDNGYADCIRPFALNVPMIFAGLDTIVVGSVDHMADYCMVADKICLHRDPNNLRLAANGVVLAPAGNAHIATEHNGENDMVWLRKQPHVFADDLWPGHVISYKVHVRASGLSEPPVDTRIVYFHGNPKPHELTDDWVVEGWR